MNSSLSGKSVLVTGAAGFIGSHLVRRLLKDNCRVIALERPAADLWRIKDIINRLEVIYCDLGALRDNELKTKLSGVNIVYHLAAAGVDQSEENCDMIIRSNVTGTLVMLELARDLRFERFIYSGSCFEYGKGSFLSEKSFPAPFSEYAVSKLAGWFLTNSFFHKYGLPVVSLKPFNVYGPYEAPYRLVPHTIINALKGRDIKLTPGEQKRDFVFIDDMVEGFIAAGFTPGIMGETFNLATGSLTSVKEIVNMIIELTNAKARPIFGAMEYRKSEIWLLSGDPSEAKLKLNWSAQTSLREGLKKTIAWFKDNEKGIE